MSDIGSAATCAGEARSGAVLSRPGSGGGARCFGSPPDAVAGWAALAPTSSRAVYRGVVWDSVYVHRDARGRGIGRLLLERLVRDADSAGIWTLQAGIFPENRASIALHQRCGFRVVGVQERLGRQDGVWRDVVLLERRSPAVG